MTNPQPLSFDHYKPETNPAADRLTDQQRREEQQRRDQHAKDIVDLRDKGYEVGPDGTPVPIKEPTIGDPSKRGEEYLKTVPEDDANRARMLMNGDLAWPNARALTDPQWKRALNIAQHAEPGLSQDIWTSRHNANTDTRPGGRLGQSQSAISTALGHLNDLWEQYQQLGNTRWQWVNGKLQDLRGNVVGDRELQYHQGRAAAAAKGVATELARVMMNGNQPNESDIKDWAAGIDLTQPPERFKGFINQGLHLINARLKATQDVYDSAMQGRPGTWHAVSPEARRLFDKLDATTNESTTPEGTKRVGLLDAAPEGMQPVSGDIKGYRFTPEQEHALSSYAREANFDPNKYAEMAMGFMKKHGVPAPDDAGRKFSADQGASLHDQYMAHPDAGDANFDYSKVDQQATANAGLGDTLMNAVKNAPASAINLAKGVVAPATDLVASAVKGEPYGLYHSLAHPVDTTNAIGSAVSDFAQHPLTGTKVAFSRDPFGTAANLELGVGALAKTGKLASLAAKYASIGDPLQGVYNAARYHAPAVVDALPDAVKNAPGNLVSCLVCMPSGVGGEAVKEAYAAGKSRPIGAPETPQSTAFTSNMRDPQSNIGSAVDIARRGVANLRQQATQRYLDAMAKFGQSPTPLSVTDLVDAVNASKPKNFDVYATAPDNIRPADHKAWQQMRDFTDHYLVQAAQDPSLLTPLKLDQFKQDLYSVGSKIGANTDRDAARIAGDTYNAVKGILIKHDPVYADTMRDYSTAAEEAAALESGFSLGKKRGQPVNVDASSRKLQSIFRNNANTNYGQRAAQGDRLAELDPSGTLMPTLSGQQASSWLPRRLSGHVTSGVLGAGLLEAGPAALLAHPASLLPFAGVSPRVAGELAYGTGRLAGTAGQAMGKVGKVAQGLGDLYEKYPTEALGISRASNYADEQQASDERDALLRRYGIEPFAPTPGVN